jgi:hypothetical protein
MAPNSYRLAPGLDGVFLISFSGSACMGPSMINDQRSTPLPSVILPQDLDRQSMDRLMGLDFSPSVVSRLNQPHICPTLHSVATLRDVLRVGDILVSDVLDHDIFMVIASW